MSGQWQRVETGSEPSFQMAAIATVVSQPTNIPPDAADFTYTADGTADTLFSDTVNLPEYRRYRGMEFTVAGNIKYQDHDGNIIGPIAVQAGVTKPWRPKRIYATLTTVTGVLLLR